MKSYHQVRIAIKALSELGVKPVGLFGLYRLGLLTGHYKRIKIPTSAAALRPFFPLPNREKLIEILGDEGIDRLICDADEIVAGNVRHFGGPPVPLDLSLPGKLPHWTEYELGREGIFSADGEPLDIKWVWEAGRFGWAYSLARAYHITQGERYAETLWRYIETFLQSNPPYDGPNWSSAQEVALRLIALAFAWNVLRASPLTTPERSELLARSIAEHAARIPPTLFYARAQNNNHLLSEAAGLYTASLALPEHPRAFVWREIGWRRFNQGIQGQITEGGVYIQHSTSYHRLMLQLALWFAMLARTQGQALPEKTVLRLAAATQWLLTLCEPTTGMVPNLGPNDGAYVQPLSECGHQDYRPVAQAASRVFVGENALPAGIWDEACLWLQIEGLNQNDLPSAIIPSLRSGQAQQLATPLVLRNNDNNSWAYLCTARFNARPGHADQLHLDLWWQGMNVARDAGTYLYNASPPWDNALARTTVHNTLTVNGMEQMTRASRFLWLDWAQSEVINRDVAGATGQETITARHDGYRRFGVIHQRKVTCCPAGYWEVRDELLDIGNQVSGKKMKRDGHRMIVSCLHWLLPDWPWEIQECKATCLELDLQSPKGCITLIIQVGDDTRPSTLESPPIFQILRAGELVFGEGTGESILGWFSPTYGCKEPALSVRAEVCGNLPISFTTQWLFPLVT